MPDDFVMLYERALATQDWSAVAPLIDDVACVTFSSGAVHEGKQAIRIAIEQNFSTIADEEYRISDVRWVYRSEVIAVYLFAFHWTGRINGRATGGSGCGTAVLRSDRPNGWKLLVEHLGHGGQ
jgi:ketosteroid isomerase-like protein